MTQVQVQRMRASIDELPERDGAVVRAEDVERPAVLGPVCGQDRIAGCHLWFAHQIVADCGCTTVWSSSPVRESNIFTN
jgi:hypothetical protein